MAKRLLIYDASENTKVGFSWKIGAFIFGLRFSKVLAVKSWDDCFQKLSNLEEKYDEVQFWGHGTPGFVYIKSEPSVSDFWFDLAKHLNPNATVWLRVCAFAATSVGKVIMSQIAKTLNAKVIAHTYLIGGWACQSGTRAVTSEQSAQWSSNEGIDREKNQFKGSSPFAPNTVSALTMTPPVWATNK